MYQEFQQWANITVDVSRYLINVPVECKLLYINSFDTCYTGCDTCPTLYTCVEKVYIGVYDTLCTHKLVNNCNFRLQMLETPIILLAIFTQMDKVQALCFTMRFYIFCRRILFWRGISKYTYQF